MGADHHELLRLTPFGGHGIFGVCRGVVIAQLLVGWAEFPIFEFLLVVLYRRMNLAIPKVSLVKFVNAFR